jgi:DNA-binding response OmpR family regulator
MSTERTTSRGSTMALRLDGIKIVIVDDDADVLESVDAALSSEGAVTRAVGNGNDAVTAVAEEKPEVVVLDMMLPGRSGFLVLEKIKGEADSPAVLMLTANEGKRHAAYASSLGVDRYLLKPAPLEKVVELCRELAMARRSEGEAGGKKRGK